MSLGILLDSRVTRKNVSHPFKHMNDSLLRTLPKCDCYDPLKEQVGVRFNTQLIYEVYNPFGLGNFSSFNREASPYHQPRSPPRIRYIDNQFAIKIA